MRKNIHFKVKLVFKISNQINRTEVTKNKACEQFLMFFNKKKTAVGEFGQAVNWLIFYSSQNRKMCAPNNTFLNLDYWNRYNLLAIGPPTQIENRITQEKFIS